MRIVQLQVLPRGKPCQPRPMLGMLSEGKEKGNRNGRIL
jgi:hypothetical protein